MKWPIKSSHFILFVFLFITNLILASSRQNDFIDHSVIDLSDQTTIYQTYDESISINEVEELRFVKLAEDAIKIERECIYWIRFNLPVNTTFPAYIKLGSADNQQLFIPGSNGNYKVQYTGYQIKRKDRSLDDHRNIFEIATPFNINQPIYAKLQSTFLRFNEINPEYYTREAFTNWERNDLENEHFYFLFNAFILGIFLIMMLYGVFSYWVTNDQTYLWYGLYLLFLGLYFALKFDNRLFYWNPQVQMSLFDPVPLISYYFYYRFVRSFLNLKKLLPAWDKILKYLGWMVLMYSAADLIFMYISPNADVRFIGYTIIRYIIILTSIIIIVRFYFTDSKLVHFINTGSLLLLIGATITMIKDPLYYMQAGVALEILFFSLGLAYRNRLNEEEKRVAQEALILEEQKELQLKSDFEKKLARVEMSSLRAQMNPHFIFNSLNSIKHYIVKNNAEAASDFLSKFSRLMRLILQNSSSNRVSLSSELEALKLYIEMEAIRFDGRFDYEFNVQESIDLEFIRIPAMLIQPYVENAIWHGLMHNEEKGKLIIDVSQEIDKLKFIIEDNGIGRREAERRKQESTQLKKSRGMEITSDRIAMMNQLYNMKAEVIIDDLVDENGNAKGTKVTLTIDGVNK